MAGDTCFHHNVVQTPKINTGAYSLIFLRHKEETCTNLIYLSMASFWTRKIIQVAGTQWSTRQEIDSAVVESMRGQRRSTILTENLTKVMVFSRIRRQIRRLRVRIGLSKRRRRRWLLRVPGFIPDVVHVGGYQS